ncbi:MAG: tRNA pseudouridine(55) synthase TruB [Eubacteriales bacterium]|nr:tRNA pseudouridine(55) synthase TruB [Eubacteriales bacterium]MDD4582687.1 tRNA pseudouridine(55) synthase TruB [Eubacteriales bacterium]
MSYEGVINLLKPAGMTSHDVVYFLRKLTKEKRIGHTGTLDPMAVGVLVLCIGSATRIIDYLDLDKKEYRCEILLGVETDTWDIWGNVIRDSRNKIKGITEETIKEAFRPFMGEIFQIPPNYSAVRIGGKRLYEYARVGQEVEVPSRPVIIYDLKFIGFDQRTGRVLFDVTCSKGTYIRSICHQVGLTLGCGGAMSFLARKASGIFQIKDGATIEELMINWQQYLLPMDVPLAQLGKLQIPSDRATWFCNGGSLRKEQATVICHPSFIEISKHIKRRKGLEKAYRVYYEDCFMGVVIYDEERKLFVADKVFSK